MPKPPVPEVAAPTGERALARCPHSRAAIKRGAVFLVSHGDGMVHGGCTCGQGLYYRDTRHLSALTWALDGQPLRALSYDAESAVAAIGHYMDDRSLLVGIARELDGALLDTVTVSNFGRSEREVELSCTFGADFLDMFVVRGFGGLPRSPGTRSAPVLCGDTVAFAYDGCDGLRRETVVALEPAPDRLELAGDQVIASWRQTLAPGGTGAIGLCARPAVRDAGERLPPARPGRKLPAGPAHKAALAEFSRVTSSNALFERFIARGTQDLLALLLPTEHGPYFAAGLPWYSCPFGRDGLITAFQALPLNSEPAIGTLRYLAAHQGTEIDPACDEEPGKILHESRAGELSLGGYAPFAPSYCTVDATPLFLILLHEVWRWTGDLDLVRGLWPHARAALGWIDRSADARGFLTYMRQGDKGLSNQGWKDSWDAVQHPDGTLAEGPIALVEVQGYVYDARRRMADLALALGEAGLAATWRAEAAILRDAFAAEFWLPDEGYLALGLAGDGRPVAAPASNPGHCLWSGILDGPAAGGVRDKLLGPGLFSGWGIRTLSADSPNFNPVSYHNGSIWPHDNALIALGLARYGFKAEAAHVAEALFHVAERDPLLRLPELFCGFEREDGARPVAYPVACSPQAWAAGTPIMLLRALLGLEPDAAAGILHVVRPHLPPWAGEVRIEGLRVGKGETSLHFRNTGAGTTVEVLALEGDLLVEVS